MLCLFVLHHTAQAAEVTGNVTGIIQSSQCTLVAKESTTGSTLIGGGVGAVGGAAAGRLIGGKKGTGWGALLGAGVGALVGANSGDETYHCKLMVDSEYGQQLIETTSERKLNKGDSINLIQTSDGNLTPML